MANLSRLPAPLAENWEWQQRGACRGADREVFFAPPGERPGPRAIREAKAKAVCATCPVIDTCLQWALRIREPYGVWGGRTPEERAAMLRPAAS